MAELSLACLAAGSFTALFGQLSFDFHSFSNNLMSQHVKIQRIQYCGEASRTIWSSYANISVFIDCENNQSPKKLIPWPNFWAAFAIDAEQPFSFLSF